MVDEGGPSMTSIWWILLTTVGLAAGVIAALLLGEPIERVVGMILVTPLLTLLVGAVLGAAQWLELRRHVEVRALRWLAGSSVGLGAGLALGVVLVEQVGRLLTGGQVRLLSLDPATRALSFAAVGAVAGLLLGFGQSLALRHKLRRWPRTCALALGLGFPLSSLLVDSLLGGLGSPRGVLAFLLTAGIVLGTLTSTPLRRGQGLH
jgi:hypothetical protein